MWQFESLKMIFLFSERSQKQRKNNSLNEKIWGM